MRMRVQRMRSRERGRVRASKPLEEWPTGDFYRAVHGLSCAPVVVGLASRPRQHGFVGCLLQTQGEHVLGYLSTNGLKDRRLERPPSVVTVTARGTIGRGASGEANASRSQSCALHAPPASVAAQIETCASRPNGCRRSVRGLSHGRAVPAGAARWPSPGGSRRGRPRRRPAAPR